MKARFQPRPPVGVPTAWAFPAFERSTLDNGMATLVCPLPGHEVARVTLVLPGGMANEEPAVAGVAATTAAALYEGTGERSADELIVALENHGAGLNAGVHWRGMRMALSVPVSDLTPVLALLTELVRQPAFRQAELERLLRRRLEQLALQRFQPQYRSVAGFGAAAFPAGSRLAVPGEGTAATVAAITADDIRGHWRSAGCPQRSTVIVSGDLQSVDVGAVLGDTLGAWPGAAVPDGAVEGAAPPSGRAVTVVDFPGAVQTNLVLGTVTARPRLEDRVALEVAAHYLGGFIGSRLSTRIREQLAASYGAGASVEYRLENTVLRLESAVETGATALAAAVMAEEVAALRLGDVRANTMREAIDNLARTAAMRFAQPGSVAAELEGIVLEGLPDDYHQHRQQELLDLTPDAVVEAFRRHTTSAGLCGAAAGDAASVADALAHLGYDVAVEPMV
jgi:predicted Zn-dependent peptidase